jgi:hypothetical protein
MSPFYYSAVFRVFHVNDNSRVFFDARFAFNPRPLFAPFSRRDGAARSFRPKQPQPTCEVVATQAASDSDNRAGESKYRLPAR